MDLSRPIDEALLRAGISLSAQAVELLGRDLALVLEANATMNLTAIRDPEQAVILHVVDSLLAIPEIDGAPRGPLVDLGAGAGFPGVPLAIATGRSLTLVESVGKKARFLQSLVDDLGLDADVVSARAEEYAAGTSKKFAIVVARAVAGLPALVELAAPLLGEGGRFVAYKGEPAVDEIERGDKVAKMVGLERVSRREILLKDAGDARRTLIAYERVGQSKVRLPRRTGLAQNQPLA
jgi:16S rRNA (guanine527-N7)-methyltransferase